MFITPVKDILHIGRQEKHIPGKLNYKEGNSYITISIKEVKELINKYATHGEKSFDKNGKWKKTELIHTNKNIGIYINKNYKTNCETNSFTIKYSSKGVHIVPANNFKEDDSNGGN